MTTDVDLWGVDEVCAFLSQLKLTRLIEDCKYHCLTGTDLKYKTVNQLCEVLTPVQPITDEERQRLSSGLDALFDRPGYTVMVDRRSSAGNKAYREDEEEGDYADVQDATLPSIEQIETARKNSRAAPRPLSYVAVPSTREAPRHGSNASISSVTSTASTQPKKRFSRMEDPKPQRPTTMRYTSVAEVSKTAAHVGWLHKRGDVRKKWKLRYFVLHEGSIYYFQTSQGDMKGSFSLNGLRIQRAVKSTREHTFQLAHVSGQGRVWILAAHNQQEMRQWIKAIRLEIFKYDDTEDDQYEDYEDIDDEEDAGDSGDESDARDDDYEEPFDDSLPTYLNSSQDSNRRTAPKVMPRIADPPEMPTVSEEARADDGSYENDDPYEHADDVVGADDGYEQFEESETRAKAKAKKPEEYSGKDRSNPDIAGENGSEAQQGADIPKIPSRAKRKTPARRDLSAMGMNAMSPVDDMLPVAAPKPLEEPESLSYFYEGLSRGAAEAMLKQPGDFLLRRSKSANPPVLSVCSGQKCKHYKIYFLAGSGHTLGFDGVEEYFGAVSDLVSCYQQKPIPTSSTILGRQINK